MWRFMRNHNWDCRRFDYVGLHKHYDRLKKKLDPKILSTLNSKNLNTLNPEILN